MVCTPFLFGIFPYKDNHQSQQKKNYTLQGVGND